MYSENLHHISEVICERVDPILRVHFGITDFIIFICYLLIPLGLIKAIRHLPKSIANELKIFGVLLIAFIVSCGLTHLANVLLLYSEIWTVAIILNWICAISSVLATSYLWVKARLIITQIAACLKNLVDEDYDTIKALKELKALITNES